MFAERNKAFTVLKERIKVPIPFDVLRGFIFKCTICL
jgi:hypothetical protein